MGEQWKEGEVEKGTNKGMNQVWTWSSWLHCVTWWHPVKCCNCITLRHMKKTEPLHKHWVTHRQKCSSTTILFTTWMFFILLTRNSLPVCSTDELISNSLQETKGKCRNDLSLEINSPSLLKPDKGQDKPEH